MADIPNLDPQGGDTLPPLPGQSKNATSSSGPIDPYNYAKDELVRERIKRELIPFVSEVRLRRQSLNETWARMFKVWTLEHEDQAYLGRSNIYVPAGKKGVETLVPQLVSSTFPGPDYFGVEARLQQFDTSALNVKALLSYFIEQVAKVRVNAERFYRQLVITGNSPAKIYYDKRSVAGQKRSSKKKMFGAPEAADITLYNGPVFKTIDVSNFYIFPENVDDPQDATLVFEDLSVPTASLRQKGEKGVYYMPEIESLSSNGNAFDQIESGKLYADQVKLQGQGISTPHGISNPTNGYGMSDITEVYVDFDPKAVDRGHEKNPRPFLITFSSSGAVLRAIQNPFWHQRPPYVFGRMGTTTGRVYGTGHVEAIRQLNVLVNDQVNQTMDCGTYSLNPVILTNPNVIEGTLSPLEPGVQWLVNDINNAVKFDRPPGDLIQSGSVLSTQTMSWINDFIGAPPVLQGGSAPGRAFKTATGIGTAQKNAVTPLQEIVRLCETEVWEPMLFHFWVLAQQFVEDELVIKTTGQPLQRFTPQDLVGDFYFRWLASSQTSNQQVKGGQITQLLQVLANPGMIQLLQANGLKLNPAPLVKRLYEEVYGFRDFDAVVTPAALGMQQGGAGPPEVGGGPGAPGAIQSGSELPSEEANPEFQSTRMQANDLSSMMGGMGGFNSGGE